MRRAEDAPQAGSVRTDVGDGRRWRLVPPDLVDEPFEGDHETLMNLRGTYARLFSLQARGYGGAAGYDDEPVDAAHELNPHVM